MVEFGWPPRVISRTPIPQLVALFYFADDRGSRWVTEDQALAILRRRARRGGQ